MRIGYPCINRRIGCTPNSTFRLANYSPQRLVETIRGNLECLQRTLAFNAEHGVLFFRIGSSLVPFASHPVCDYDWADHFRSEFSRIGRFAGDHGMRLSMHPDQFVLINALDPDIIARSAAELVYHAQVLDLMELDRAARVQIHIGGAYGDRPAALDRFCENYQRLSEPVRRRLAIENDERLFGLSDCLTVHRRTGVPIVFDRFHHECLNAGESVREALRLAAATWQAEDGPLMVDYSTQAAGQRAGRHSEHLDPEAFEAFLAEAVEVDPDVMLEIKDKEASAIDALAVLKALEA